MILAMGPDGSTAVRLGVVTSGGDAPGMNAALRAVVRTTIALGGEPVAVLDGFSGLLVSPPRLEPMRWDSVSSIQHRGGTVIGTARCDGFRDVAGRRHAAAVLAAEGIDRLVVIGGDGSLAGALALHREHPDLRVCGLPGTIDNDVAGTDTTLGADSALHRIVSAIDALASTAASHHRCFVVEVMGRRSGYLAVTAAVAGGCDVVFVPEEPAGPRWRDELVATLRAARAAGRRDSMIVVAEGATDSRGATITAARVAEAVEDGLADEARVTILGHVQRGGTASPFDRCLGTVLGARAARALIEDGERPRALFIGVENNRVVEHGLESALEPAATGSTAASLLGHLRATAMPAPVPAPGARRVGVVHVGGLAPGMNVALRALVRLGLARGMRVAGVRGGLAGLRAEVKDLGWQEVDGLVAEGGAVLGTSRYVPDEKEATELVATVAERGLDALVVVGGLNGLLAAERLRAAGATFPIACLPATLDNNVPGSEFSVGADSALGGAVFVLDRVKQSASASTRCFVAETMGRRCGYLTLMTAIATGAERVYLHEDGLSLEDVEHDVERMRVAFRGGRRLFLALRGEHADDRYTTDVLADLFAAESQGLYDVRTTVVGHMQQGCDPSPFDRLLATLLAGAVIEHVSGAADGAEPVLAAASGGVVFTRPLDEALAMLDRDNERPRQQWWMAMRPLAEPLSIARS